LVQRGGGLGGSGPAQFLPHRTKSNSQHFQVYLIRYSVPATSAVIQGTSPIQIQKSQFISNIKQPTTNTTVWTRQQCENVKRRTRKCGKVKENPEAHHSMKAVDFINDERIKQSKMEPL